MEIILQAEKLRLLLLYALLVILAVTMMAIANSERQSESFPPVETTVPITP